MILDRDDLADLVDALEAAIESDEYQAQDHPSFQLEVARKTELLTRLCIEVARA